VEKLSHKRWRDERWRIFAPLHERILALRPEQMEVGVGRAMRHVEARRVRVQILALTSLGYFSHSWVPLRTAR
jgi:hypothetical protein